MSKINILKERKTILFSSLIIVTFITALLTLSSSATASDHSAGGGGGSIVSGSMRTPMGWAVASGYGNFVHYNGMGNYTTTALNNTGADLAICQRSNYIWWYEATWTRGGFGWVWNLNSRYGTYSNTQPDMMAPLTNPFRYGNSNPPSESISAISTWDSTLSRSTPRLYNTQNRNGIYSYNVICSAGVTGYLQTRTNTITETQTRQITTGTPYTAPISYVTQVSPQILVSGSDPIGTTSFVPQLNSITTPFGTLYNSYATNQNITAADETAIVNAINSGTTTNHSTLDLSTQNKTSLAEGGVLNVSENTTTATINVGTVENQQRTRSCNVQQKRDWNASTWSWGSWYNTSSSCGAWSEWTTTSTSKSVTSKVVSTPLQTGFYQMILVHCNPLGFSDLISSFSGGRIASVSYPDSANGKFTAYAITRTYNNSGATPASTVMRNDNGGALMFGDLSSSNAARAASGSLGFYDKECSYVCTNSSTGSSSAVPTTANGGTSNIGNTLNVQDLYGATMGDGINTNYYEIFRDNENRIIKVDTWYPITGSNGITYNGAAALSTTVTRWSEGTPKADGSDGGQFTMLTKTGTPIFGTDTSALTQRNWNSTSFHSLLSGKVAGTQNEFIVKANWPSEEAYPQILNIKWEYAPTITTQFPANGIGFNASGGQTSGTNTPIATTIEGKCVAQFGTNTPEDLSSYFQNYTGTGTTNTFDSNILNPAGQETDSHNLVITFVRATTE